MRRRRGVRRLWWLPILLALSTLASCMGSGSARDIIRGTPPTAGLVWQGQYSIERAGDSVVNLLQAHGMGPDSPMPATSTSYSESAGVVSQQEMLTGPNGDQIAALGMSRTEQDFGLSEYLKAYQTTYEQRDKDGNRVCGAKVRLTWQPILAQAILHDEFRRSWDALFYYSIPCSAQVGQPEATLDLGHAKFLALVIDQQFTPRIVFGEPSVFNRGHSVTIVGGPAAKFVGGWWLYSQSILAASHMVVGMVKALDQHEWLSLGPAYPGAGLVYSAGDADVYASFARFFLNRQSDYLVHFRSDPNQPWHMVLVHPRYNIEWNDLQQQWNAWTNTDWPALSDLVDTNTGRPKSLDPSDDNGRRLKEIEKAGCQNCPNATLEQVELLNPVSHQPLYAATIRGYLGSDRSLVLFGAPPGSINHYLGAGSADSRSHGFTRCPIFRDQNGQRLSDDKQYTPEECAGWLAEGGLFDYLTTNPAKSGTDVSGQFEVVDNSSWSSHCDDGNPPTCVSTLDTPRFNGSYMFTDAGAKLFKAWTIMQLLGEVGMRTLGFSYASGPYEGSGLVFAMAQPIVWNAYFHGVTAKAGYNPEDVFALDARALQLPGTLEQASQDLYGLAA